MENEIIENETEPEVNDSEPTSEETGGSESSTDSIESPEPETPTETDDTSETENNAGNSDSTSESEEPGENDTEEATPSDSFGEEDSEENLDEGFTLDDSELINIYDVEPMAEVSVPDTFFEKPFTSYTVAEGLLLLIFVILFIRFCIEMSAKLMHWRMF